MKPGTKTCKQKRTHPWLAGLMTAALALGCPSCGSWSGNPPSSKVETGTTAPVEKKGTVEILIQGTGASLQLANRSLPVKDKNGKDAGQLILDTVQLNVSDISIRSDRGDSTARPSLAGPFTVDLLKNVISPTPGLMILPEGSYKDIHLQLSRQSGSSFTLSGTYISPNQKSSAVRIALDAQDELSLMKDSAARIIQVADGGLTRVVIRFQLDQWFDFSGRTLDLSAMNGKDITLDPASNGDAGALRELFLGKVKAAVDFDNAAATSDNKDGKPKDDRDRADHRDGPVR